MPAGRTLYSLGAGLALGALSWGIVPLVSERFEPFDSGVAFLSGQAALCVTAFAIGYFFPARQVLVYVLGVYVSNNAYPWFFGPSDSREWALLGLFTSILLCLLPALSGMLGVTLRKRH